MHNKAERLKKTKTPAPKAGAEHGDRLPPGQMLTEKFPILHEGEVPEYDLSTWDLKVFGEVEEEKVFSFAELQAMPQVNTVSDIHCVTRWSKFDTPWEGIRFSDFIKLLGVKPEAKYVMVHADHDYETNVPLEELMRDDVLLAFKYNGEPLTPKHGYPLRLVVPQLYFWKSAKWIRGLEFMTEDRNGFWESNGFHHFANPFKEQRFSGEDLPIPEDEWTKKEFD
ncbi:sulfite oxidase-like oxidoreductase [Paenibacillus illinoisensis]|uniref:sulfite oxidase-like oxidoreductase n=1 Tax=Paenibacillus illinoisensis TaxID=59845 RepID=UPI001C8D42A4|nr:sulfite oxidase-like oxidoreductase [Paenibacillus illinoisensis]MBY0215798.1 sulfite oxidase-like oxidoreductase [Paenibacillus illinoisensis]